MRDAAPSHGAEVSALAERIGGVFGWGAGSTFRVLDSWISRTSSLHKVEVDRNHPPVVIKIADDWDAATVQEIIQELDLFAGELKRSGLNGVAIPELVGWDEYPPSVCCEYVDGIDFEAVLAGGLEESQETIESTIWQAGGFLGLFHSVWRRRLEPLHVERGAGRAKRQADGVARRLLVPTAGLRGLDFSRSISRQYGDFGPHNLRIAEGGKVYVVDQPRRWKTASVHLDAAYFLYHLERKIACSEPWDHPETGPNTQRLTRVFLEGYRRTGPALHWEAEDMVLLSLHMSHKHLGRARSELVRRRLESALRHARLALKWRRAVLQPTYVPPGLEENPTRIAS